MKDMFKSIGTGIVTFVVVMWSIVSLLYAVISLAGGIPIFPQPWYTIIMFPTYVAGAAVAGAFFWSIGENVRRP